ncbi:MAG: hypothetical protein HKO81_09455 [Flavobacteriaceae bacterium]|nr:hypothetical protein [Flavobacteriaceae bacterium]
MKKISLLLFGLLFINLVIAQDQAIKITNQITKKEVVIKENKRIKIKTRNGEKISGRFMIENDNTISVNNHTINLIDIEEIKRNPFLISVLTSGLLIYGGAITAGFGVIIGIFVESTGFLLIIPAAGMIYAGIKSPNFHKKYKPGNNLTIEIISLSD